MLLREDFKADQGVMRVVVGVFLQGGIGATCSFLETPNGTLHSQGWVINETLEGIEIPRCLEMAGLKHALQIIQEYFQDPTNVAPSAIFLRVANKFLLANLLHWFNEGTFRANVDVAIQSG